MPKIRADLFATEPGGVPGAGRAGPGFGANRSRFVGEFGDAGIENSDRSEICGLAARLGEETSAGCGLAHAHASDG